MTEITNESADCATGEASRGQMRFGWRALRLVPRTEVVWD